MSVCLSLFVVYQSPRDCFTFAVGACLVKSVRVLSASVVIMCLSRLVITRDGM